MIKRGLLAIQLLIDGLLLLFSYYLFYYLKKKEWILQDYYDTYLLILMGTWFLVTIFSKKFREKDHASLFTTMVELFYTTLKIGGVVTIFLYFTSWYDLSRVIIYGSLGFFLILEILFISIWMWLTSHYRFFQIIPLAVWFFLLEWMGLTVCFSFISYLKKGVWIPLHGDSYLFFIILFLWVVIGNRAHGFHFSVEKNLSRTLFPFWKAEVALFLIISFIFFFFKIFYFSRFIILFSIACFAVFENLLIIAWYGYSNRGKIDENDPSLLNAQIIDQISP